MKIAPLLAAEPGNIFRLEDADITVNDYITNDVVLVAEHVLFMSLGRANVERALPTNCYDFYFLESDRTLTLDEIDSAILEVCSTEIS